MKRFLCIMTVAALACFATTAFAEGLANPLGAAADAAKAKMADQAVKAVSGEIIIGPITRIDPKAGTIVVKDQAINVKADMIAGLKMGQKVKVTLVSGTMNAESIVPLDRKEAKKEAKKKVKKTKEKAIEKAVDKLNEQATTPSAQ